MSTMGTMGTMSTMSTMISWMNIGTGLNRIAIKRDDLYPVSFGGNKARKAVLFFEEIDRRGADCVVTYGSSSSNHCRVIANMAAARNMPCRIISPSETQAETSNSRLVELLGAQYIYCPVNEVHDTIERVLRGLREKGYSPYFIQGGGHGNIGTQAYVDVYSEILAWEQVNAVYFDYIFLASGTGTTQAGLVAGQILAEDFKRRVIGISIARPYSRGSEIVRQSVREYLTVVGKEERYRDELIHFDTDFLCGGYGLVNEAIKDTIRQVLRYKGIPLCGTYTGKAFWGMTEHIKKNEIRGKNILFIHTGGTPLFFDDLKGL